MTKKKLTLFGKIFLFFIISLISIIIIFIILNSITITITIPKNIVFEKNFSFEEKLNVMKIISDIKSEYLFNSTTIIFTKEIIERDTFTFGLNNGTGILVWYDGDLKRVKRTICHELLHNIIKGEGNHFFIYDLANLNVCYKNENFAYYPKF